MPPRSLLRLFLLFQLLPFVAGVLAAVPEVLIDTKFDNSSADGSLVAGNAAPPLENPDLIAPKDPTTSRIVAGKETIGTLKPPYALFKIGEKVDDASGFISASLRWNLVPLGLLSGVYELTATITPLEGNVVGGRLLVAFGAEGGKPLPAGRGVHPTLAPVQFYFAGSTVRLGNKSQPLNMGQPYEVKLRFDLNKRTWSGWLNGEELLTDFPFPPQLGDTTVPLQATNLSFGSMSGMGDKPDVSYAIAGIKLVKVGE